MPAACYWCTAEPSPGKVPGALGLRGDVIGTCFKCHVLACGEHALRDKSKQEFRCWDCLFIKLIASAINSSAALTTADKAQLKEWDDNFGAGLDDQDDVFETFEVFRQSYPVLADRGINVFRDSGAVDFWPTIAPDSIKKFSEDGKEFLVAAANLITAVRGDNGVSQEDGNLKYYLFQILNKRMTR